jgi:hypothetical protein
MMHSVLTPVGVGGMEFEADGAKQNPDSWAYITSRLRDRQLPVVLCSDISRRRVLLCLACSLYINYLRAATKADFVWRRFHPTAAIQERHRRYPVSEYHSGSISANCFRHGSKCRRDLWVEHKSSRHGFGTSAYSRRGVSGEN